MKIKHELDNYLPFSFFFHKQQSNPIIPVFLYNCRPQEGLKATLHEQDLGRQPLQHNGVCPRGLRVLELQA